MIILSQINLDLRYVNFQHYGKTKQVTLQDILELPYDERKYLSFIEVRPGEYIIHFFLSRQSNLALEYMLEVEDEEQFNTIKKQYYDTLRTLYHKV